MSGTAYDAILQNLSAAASDNMHANGLQFASKYLQNQRTFNAQMSLTSQKNALISQMMDASSAFNNPTHALAQGFANVISTPAQQIAGAPAASDSGFFHNPFTGHSMGTVGQAVMDVLSRTSQGAGAVFDMLHPEGQKAGQTIEGGLPEALSRLGHIPEAFVKGAFHDTGKAPIAVSEVLRRGMPEDPSNPLLNANAKVGKFLAGLAADVGTDPLSYVGKGALGIGLGKIDTKLAGKAVEDVAATPTVADLLKPTESWAKTPSTLQPIGSPDVNPGDFRAAMQPERIPATNPGDFRTAMQDAALPYRSTSKELAPFEKPRFAADATGVMADTKNPVSLVNELAAKDITHAVTQAPVLAHPDLNIDPLYHEITTTTTQRIPKVIEETYQAPVKAAAKKASEAVPDARVTIRDAILKTPEYKVAGHSIEKWNEAIAKTSQPEKLKADFENLLGKQIEKVHSTRDFAGLPNGGQLLKAVRGEGTSPVAKAFDTSFLKDLPGAPVAKTVTKTRKRTIFEDVHQTSTSLQRLSKAEKLAWTIKHSEHLSPEEIKYLGSANSKNLFDKRVAEIRTKTLVGGSPKTLNQFIDMAKKGHIPQEYVDKILKDQGVKTLDALEKKATKVFKASGAAKKTVEEAAPKLEDFAEPVKVERTKAPLLDEWWKDVKTPSDIINEVAHQGASVLMHDAPEITPQIVADLGKALPETIFKNVVDPADREKWAWVTNIDHALKTSPDLFKGKARNYYGWHSFTQSDMVRSLVNSASARSAQIGQGLKGAANKNYWEKVRPEQMYNEVIPAIQVAEEALSKTGVKLIAGHDNSGIMMSMGDVLTALPKDLVKKYMFMVPSVKGVARNMHVYPTGFMNAAEHMVTAALHGGNIDIAKQAAYHSLRDVKWGGNLTKFGVKGEAAAKDIVKQMSDNMPTLLQKVNERYAAYSIELGQAVPSMSEQVTHDVLSLFTDPNAAMGDAFAAVVNRGNSIAKVGTALKAPTEASKLARTLTDTTLVKNGIAPGDLAEANVAAKIAAASTPIEKSAAGVAQQASREAEARTISAALGEEAMDLGEVFDLKLKAGTFRGNMPLLNKVGVVKDILGRNLIGSYGIDGMHEMLWSGKNVSREFSELHRALLSKTAADAVAIAGNNATKYLQEAWRHLQMGSNIEDPKMLSIVQDMKKSVDAIFSGGREGAFAARNGFFTEHMNSLMDYYGVPKHMRFDEGKSLSEQPEIWRSWTDVEDPLDALDRIHSAGQFALTDATIARSISTSSEFASKVAKEGFSKVTDRAGQSTLFKYMDKNMYYNTDFLKQLPYYQEIRDLATSQVKNRNLRAFLSLYDTVQRGWKTGVTVLRPGHHLGNAMGDMILNFLAGVDNPMIYKKAMGVLAGRAKIYRDWDGMAALQADQGLAKSVASGGRVVAAKKFNMTYDQVWRAAHGQGLLSDYHVTQDILSDVNRNTGRMVAKSAPARAGRQVLKAAGRTSDFINHHTRMAQFIDVLQKSKAATLEEAIAEAGRATRKWHPDGTDLTNTERKVFRRLMPFYAWMRKSTPLIIEALATKPGRAMVLPKAMNNFAQVMGIDPNSIADPFPESAFLPSYIREAAVLGPEWTASNGHQLGLSLPGDPLTGTLNGVMSDPVKNILNGLSPIIKAPYELKTGHNIANPDIKIANKGEYLDQQTPIVGPLSNIMNRSVFNGMAPQQDVQKGYAPAGIDNLALTNLLSGLGVKDYSKPQYGSSTVAELRQKYKAQARGR